MTLETTKRWSRRTWTELEDEELRNLITSPERRLSAKAIGKILKRGQSSIVCRAKILGLKPHKRGRMHKYTKEKIEEIKKLINEGVRPRDIMRITGLEESQVSYIRKRHNLQAWTDKIWENRDILLLQELIKDNNSLDIIKDKIHKSYRSIFNKIQELYIDSPDIIEKFKEQQFNSNRQIIKSKLAFSIKRSADQGWECNLTYDYLILLLEKQKNKCYYTGIELEFKRHSGDCFSIDRIDSNKGYTEDNIVLCTWDANRMKQNMTTERFLYMCEKICKHNKSGA